MKMQRLLRQGALLVNLLIVAIWLFPWLMTPAAAGAQGGNLLNNGGFEQPHGRDYPSLTAPPGWSIWATSAESGWQDRRPETRQVQRGDAEIAAALGVYEGNGAFDAYKGWSTFSVSLYQTVGNIQPGSTLRLTAFGRIWSCNNNQVNEDDCLGGRVESNTSASFRVGIDPTGGNDPNSGNIVWSSPIAPYSGFQQASVEAVATGSSVTVVLNARMELPARHQHTFWDGASLTVVTGGAGAPGAPAQPTATPVPQLAPVVYPQGPREDGSVVHVVGSGDTLAAIAVAYGIELSELLELNNLTYEQARLIYPGQELIVRPAPLVPGGESSGAGQAGDAVSEAGGSEGQAASGGEAVSMGPTVQPVQEFAPAPVAQAVVPVMNLDARSDGRVCTLLFDDISPNRVRESGEPLLAGGQIDLSQAGATLQSYTTDGQSEPHCFEGLAAGQYMIRLVLPASYGVTTPDSYVLNVSAGQTVEAIFGAAAGYMPPPASASGAGGLFSDESGSETDTYADSLTGLLLQYSGVIVLALAGVVLLGGIVLALVFRR